MGLMALIELGDLRGLGGFTGNPQNADALKLGRHAPNSDPRNAALSSPIPRCSPVEINKIDPRDGQPNGREK